MMPSSIGRLTILLALPPLSSFLTLDPAINETGQQSTWHGEKTEWLRAAETAYSLLTAGPDSTSWGVLPETKNDQGFVIWESEAGSL
ncbi:hypothetical protein J3F83DRAFT_722747, partial [Trichoderma novae-zelandiae]